MTIYKQREIYKNSHMHFYSPGPNLLPLPLAWNVRATKQRNEHEVLIFQAWDARLAAAGQLYPHLPPVLEPQVWPPGVSW